MNKSRQLGAAFFRRNFQSWSRSTPVLGRNKYASQQRWLSSGSGRRNGHQRTTSAPLGSNRGGTGIPTYLYALPLGSVAITGYFYYSYLEEVPLTHRKRWLVTSAKWEAQLGDQEYRKLLQQFQQKGQILPKDHRASRTVQRVGSRIAQAAHHFARQHNLAHHNDISTSPYTYTVIKSEMANAFVLPNNHVFVFTGLFNYIQTEDDLAAVLGHECAHNLARHVGEKLSASFVTNLLARLSLLIDPSGALFMIFMPAATLFRDLPHSRTQETEADHIGVFLAAEACYDPRAAKRVFAAMKKGMEASGAPPEFLSTHPSHESRISNFDQWLPDAMNVYKGDGFGVDRCHQVRQQMKLARQQAAQQAAVREGKRY